MPGNRALSIVVPIFKGKGDIGNCSCCGASWAWYEGGGVPGRVLELVLWKRELPEVLVGSVMSLYVGALEEFAVEAGIHQASVLSLFFCSGGRCCR